MGPVLSLHARHFAQGSTGVWTELAVSVARAPGLLDACAGLALAPRRLNTRMPPANPSQLRMLALHEREWVPASALRVKARADSTSIRRAAGPACIAMGTAMQITDMTGSVLVLVLTLPRRCPHPRRGGTNTLPPVQDQDGPALRQRIASWPPCSRTALGWPAIDCFSGQPDAAEARSPGFGRILDSPPGNGRSVAARKAALIVGIRMLSLVEPGRVGE